MLRSYNLSGGYIDNLKAHWLAEGDLRPVELYSSLGNGQG